MIFRSNISAPDLAPHFRLLSRPRHWSFGHDVPSDPDYEPECGFHTHDEAAILFQCARRTGGNWVDIGSRFGWTAAHILAAGCRVLAIDPEYKQAKFFRRAEENLAAWPRDNAESPRWGAFAWESGEFFRELNSGTRIGDTEKFDGVCIDGNHDHPEPLNDAIGAMEHLKPTGVIVFHDMWGSPQAGAKFLMEHGFQCRVYYTPNGMGVCWRGDFEPPEHVGDPAIRAAITRDRFPDFPLERCV